MILDIIAMAIGYFVMFIIGFTVVVIIPLAIIGRRHAERNARIYKDELKRDIQKLAEKLEHEPSSN